MPHGALSTWCAPSLRTNLPSRVKMSTRPSPGPSSCTTSLTGTGALAASGASESVTTTGEFPHGFASSEHRRSKYDCRLSAAQRDMWSARFRALHHVHVHGRPVDSVTIVLVEGLLLYYNAQVRRLIDIPLFLRVSRAEVLARRTSRSNYILEDGSTWVDPPFYFDEIVWPAYTEAHACLFTGGDVERGALTDACAADAERDGAPVANMVLFDGCGPSDRASPRTVAVPQPDRDGVELAQAVCAVLLDAIK